MFNASEESRQIKEPVLDGPKKKVALLGRELLGENVKTGTPITVEVK